MWALEAGSIVIGDGEKIGSSVGQIRDRGCRVVANVNLLSINAAGGSGI